MEIKQELDGIYLFQQNQEDHDDLSPLLRELEKRFSSDETIRVVKMADNCVGIIFDGLRALVKELGGRFPYHDETHINEAKKIGASSQVIELMVDEFLQRKRAVRTSEVTSGK